MIGQDTVQRLPTPISHAVWRALAAPPQERQSRWLRAFGETLRFVALLALHDRLVHDGPDAWSGARIRDLPAVLRRPLPLGQWSQLLRRCCDGPADAPRFIPELAGFGARTRSDLDRLLSGRNDAFHRGVGLRQEAASASEYAGRLEAFLEALDFLRHYTMAVITTAGRARISFRLLVGHDLFSIPLAFDRAADEGQVQKGDLFLLDTRRMTALKLTPAFLWYPMRDQDHIWGVQGVEGDEQGLRAACYDSFVDDAELVLASRRLSLHAASHPRLPIEVGSEDDPGSQEIAGWLDGRLGFVFPATAAERRPALWIWKRLLTDDGWAEVRSFGDGAHTSTIGRRHRARAVEARTIEDVYRTLSGAHTIHLLRPARRDHAPSVRRFRERAAAWQALEHAAAQRPVEVDVDSADPAPYVVVEEPRDAVILADLLAAGDGSLSPGVLSNLVHAASDLCEAAHAQGLRLLTLPPRDLRLSTDGALFATAFETLCPANQPRTTRWAELTEAAADMAPELERTNGFLPPTVDLFAIGTLIARLRRRDPAAMTVLPEPHRDDPWECLAYHCLAVDPWLRFQSPAQLRACLDLWVESGSTAPDTVPIGPLRFGRYPITNMEYERFCRQKPWPLPHRGNRARLQGPWCPVVGTSLRDAEAYARWLSGEAGGRWRVPTEEEWLLAAGAGPSSDGALDTPAYPWGDVPPTRATANFGRACRGPTVVGAFPASDTRSGCRDMGGNVWEWCSTRTRGPHYVIRGGAYDHPAGAMRLDCRGKALYTYRSHHLGFRVLRED